MADLDVSTRLGEALRKSEARFKAFVMANADVVYRMSPAWDVMQRLDGMGFLADTRDPSRNWLMDYIPDNERERVTAEIDAAIRTRSVFELEHEVMRADGTLGWTLSRAVPVLDEAGEIVEWIGSAKDVTDRKRAEEALRAGEARHAFLLEISDALRSLDDASEIQAAAAAVLGERLGADRVGYAEDLSDTGEIAVTQNYTRGVAGLQGRYRYSDYGVDLLPRLRAGHTVIRNDIANDPGLSEAERRAHALLNLGATVNVPLVRAQRLQAVLFLHYRDAHAFSAQEIDFLTETAERVWLAIEAARARAAQRASETQQAFLLKLSDALRPLTDPVAVQAEACRLIGEHLGVDRAYYVEVDEAIGIATVEKDYTASGAPSLAGRHPVASFSWSVEILRRGECHVVDDTRTSPLVPLADRAALAALQIVACMGAPLIKAGRLVGALCVTASDPKVWADAEVELLKEVGERIWAAVERARAETALQESETRFAQFAASSSDALWIRDAATLEMEYASPAIESIYGVPPEALLDGTQHWTALIVPEDRDGALTHLERSKAGDAVVHEFRIRRPSDGVVRWIRDTDFPLRDAQGRVQRIGGIAQDITAAKLATERQDVLVAELQHRTRNLISVVQAIAGDTMEHTGPTEAFREAFADRLSALSRVQGLLSRSEAEPITIGALVRLELDALGASAVGDGVAVAGPEVFLKPSTVQTLALALHELATNARKHGALSHDHGHLTVRWREVVEAGGQRLALDWIESGLERAPERPTATRASEGYGRELIEQALPHALGARTTYALTEAGVHCTIEIPVRPRALVRGQP